MSTNKSPLAALIHKVDSYLWQHGYRLERVRIIVRSLFLFNVFVLLFALLALPLTLVPLSFSLAALLAFWNFASMSKHIVQNFPVGGAAKISFTTLLLWLVRLVVIVGLSFIALVYLKLPALAWFIGLGTQLFIAPLSNIFYNKKSK